MGKNVVIIGAGLAGTLICNELVGKCNVILLEIGEKERISYPMTKFVDKPLATVKTFCYGGGGTTNLWHNGLIPIQEHDISIEPFKKIISESKTFMDKAAENLYWVGSSFSAEYMQLVSEMKDLAKESEIYCDGVDCLLYPHKYNKLEADPNIHAYYSVNRINFDAEEKNIKKITFYINDKKYTIEVDIVVISAGALGSPSLVNKVLSAIGKASSSVGVGFIDHPIGFLGKVKVKKSHISVVKKFSLFRKKNYDCLTALRIKSDCGKYSAAVFFRPSLTMSNHLSITKFKSILGASRGLERLKNAISFKLFHPDILAEIFSHLFGIRIPSRIFNLLVVFEQKRGDSKVSFNNDVIELSWDISERELAIYRQILKKIKQKLGTISDEININTEITKDWLWSEAHHSGTLSLGKDHDDLLDIDLKLKITDNVYVCDGSVIQEHSYANTGLTIAQLAMRLADRISKLETSS